MNAARRADKTYKAFRLLPPLRHRREKPTNWLGYLTYSCVLIDIAALLTTAASAKIITSCLLELIVFGRGSSVDQWWLQIATWSMLGSLVVLVLTGLVAPIDKTQQVLIGIKQFGYFACLGVILEILGLAFLAAFNWLWKLAVNWGFK